MSRAPTSDLRPLARTTYNSRLTTHSAQQKSPRKQRVQGGRWTPRIPGAIGRSAAHPCVPGRNGRAVLTVRPASILASQSARRPAGTRRGRHVPRCRLDHAAACIGLFVRRHRDRVRQWRGGRIGHNRQVGQGGFLAADLVFRKGATADFADGADMHRRATTNRTNPTNPDDETGGNKVNQEFEIRR